MTCSNFTNLQACIHVHVCMYTHTHACVHPWVCVPMYMYICMFTPCTWTQTCSMHVHGHRHVLCMHMYMGTDMFYACTCTWAQTCSMHVHVVILHGHRHVLCMHMYMGTEMFYACTCTWAQRCSMHAHVHGHSVHSFAGTRVG